MAHFGRLVGKHDMAAGDLELGVPDFAVRAGKAHHLGRAERLLVIIDRAGRVADDEVGGDAGITGGNCLDHEKSPRVSTLFRRSRSILLLAYLNAPVRNSPTATPSIAKSVCAGFTTIGSNAEFSGCSTISRPRRFRRLTVTSSPAAPDRRATTICPERASAVRCTTSKSPS